MALQSLDIQDFRNIHRANLEFSPGLNLVTGKNAAGKTSLMEAVYYLGRVRSFRTPHVDQPIRTGQPAFRLVGRLQHEQGRAVPIGIERRTGGGLQVHLDGAAVRRLSDLAGSFPVQILSGDTANIISGGPRYRRQTLDWALFHVEQSYRDVWQRYARALRQRNAALRAQVPANQISSWDGELVEAGMEIHAIRLRYIESLTPRLQSELQQLLPDLDIRLGYRRGWSAERDLAAQLRHSLESDRSLGNTRCGPHRADFSLVSNGQPLQAHCSRGQQKAAVIAFMLAQLKCQQDRSIPLGAFLLDDLGSELDENHQARVLAVLRALEIQVFITAIGEQSAELADWPETKRFHVEHGHVEEVV